jgi:hypothetical protein
MSPLLIKISKDLKLVCCPRSLAPTLVTLPSMSLNPSAPFATLWTTIDPIGNVALFAGLTAALTRSERHRTALKAVFYAAIILVAAITVGQVS